MGEKIKDLHSIKIGNSSLMIELNEGYSASQGRLIHIQNEKFRYLLKEKDFLHLASTVMRGWSEFSYLKDKMVLGRAKDYFPERKVMEISEAKTMNSLLQQLQYNKICYRTIDAQDKLWTIIVKKECYSRFAELMRKNSFQEYLHPFSETNGYRFLYQMEPFHLYRVNDIYLEVFCQIPCASLTDKTWIPLDKKIQALVWENEIVEDSIIWCDKICRYMYHLCWAIFHNQGFSPFEREFLSSNRDLLGNQTLLSCMTVVFFKFTEILSEKLKSNDYDSILPEYHSFLEY